MVPWLVAEPGQAERVCEVLCRPLPDLPPSLPCIWRCTQQVWAGLHLLCITWLFSSPVCLQRQLPSPACPVVLGLVKFTSSQSHVVTDSPGACSRRSTPTLLRCSPYRLPS